MINLVIGLLAGTVIGILIGMIFVCLAGKEAHEDTTKVLAKIMAQLRLARSHLLMERRIKTGDALDQIEALVSEFVGDDDR